MLTCFQNNSRQGNVDRVYITPRLVMIQGLPIMVAETWYNVDYADQRPSPSPLALAVNRTQKGLTLLLLIEGMASYGGLFLDPANCKAIPCPFAFFFFSVFPSDAKINEVNHKYQKFNQQNFFL